MVELPPALAKREVGVGTVASFKANNLVQPFRTMKKGVIRKLRNVSVLATSTTGRT